MIRRNLLGIALLGAGSVLSGATAEGALLASDAFDYSAGSTLGAQSSAGGGWSTGWMGNSGLTFESGATVLADSLSAPLGYAPVLSGGSAIQEAMLLYRGLDTSAYIDLSVDKDYYISYLTQRTPVPITTRSFTMVLQTGGVVGGDNLVLAGSSTGGDPFAALGGSGTVVEDLNLIGNGSTDLWVVKIAASAASADQVFVKVYDTTLGMVEASETEDWDVLSNTESNDFTATQIAFTMGAGATLQLDEIRIGESWEDVVPFLAPTLDGDLDGDGFVGISDLNIVLGDWNQNVPPGDPLADPSGDGFVGIQDLNTVLGNWNAGTPPAVTAVPEPISSALLAAGGLALLRSRNRR